MNLNNKPKQIVYSDFSYDFSAHPKTGDITLLKNEDAVKNAVKNLLLTNYGEILFDYTIGSGLYHKLFEPLDQITLRTIERDIIHTLNNFEPRVIINNIRFRLESEHALTITLYYNIINIIEKQSVDIFLEKIR